MLFRAFVVAAVAVAATNAFAATSGASVHSPMGGNGHSISFDGRVFVAAEGDGWNLFVLRPELVAADDAGFPVVEGAFADRVLIQPVESCENALALCTPDADASPYACNDAGDADSGGVFACYDFVVIDSNACGTEENRLRYRNLHVVIENPDTPSAAYRSHTWTGDRTPLMTSTGASLRGIEPTITRDGKLLVYQGHPDNDGKIDILMYAHNDGACGVDGWSSPHVISHMTNDPSVSSYRLAERTLRAADGDPYADDGLVHGAYPWVFPDGEAVSFTSVTVPCRAENDPSGCGPRRGGIAVLGYPTNWGLAHVDGAVNPDTDQTVRLFFTSPGPTTFAQLPKTPGADVWPFFGSNTSNYTELVFDDGLDGKYAGVWLMNESVNKNGDLNRTRTPDTSGYFNSGHVEGGAAFPLRNEGPRGKTIAFDGASGRVRVDDDVSLAAVNGLTFEMTLRPDADVDCDGNNNWRALVDKGGVGAGAFSLVFEEGNTFQARVKAGGEQRSVWANAAIPVGQWSTIAFSYQASTGLMTFRVNGVETNTAQYAPATLDAAAADLFIGGPGGSHNACPDGNGAFLGQIEEARLSRVDRFHADDPIVGGEGEGEGVVGEGEGDGDGVVGEGEGAEGGEGEGEGAGVALDPGDGVHAPKQRPPAHDGCASTPPSTFAALATLLLVVVRRRRQ